MPWLSFAVTLLATFVVQISVVHALGLRSLDLFLTLTLLIGLLAPVHEARIAGWLVGLVQCLQSDVRFGVEPFSLGLTAFLLTGLRGLLNTEVWWARPLVVFLAALPGQLFTVTIDWIKPFHNDPNAQLSVFTALGAALWVSTLAALLSTVLSALPGLWRRRRAGFRPSRSWG
jgi:hypothetical protein